MESGEQTGLNLRLLRLTHHELVQLLLVPGRQVLQRLRLLGCQVQAAGVHCEIGWKEEDNGIAQFAVLLECEGYSVNRYFPDQGLSGMSELITVVSAMTMIGLLRELSKIFLLL